jgi:hypothetical protein
MAFLESILTKIGLKLVEWLWAKLELKLQEYFEIKSKIKSISNEAGALKEELKNATTDAERFQILRKINNFQDRIGL